MIRPRYVRAGSFLLVLSLLLTSSPLRFVTPAAAQDYPSFTVDIVRSCEGATVSLGWMASPDVASMTATEINSYEGTEATITVDISLGVFDFPSTLAGMNIIQVNATLTDGSAWQYAADATACGVLSPVGGMVSDPPIIPDPAYVAVSGWYLTCGEAGGFGFDYSASREMLWTVWVLQGDDREPAGDTFAATAGSFYYQWANSGDLSIEVVVYEASDSGLTSPVAAPGSDVSCEAEETPTTPAATNTPVSTVTQTPDPTNTAVPTVTQTPDPTKTPVPTATSTSVPTNTPVPTVTQSPQIPTPQPTNAPVQVPDPPVTQVVEPPTPQTLTIVFQLPEPTGAISNIHDASVSSKPGDRVRVNIAKPGDPPDWEIITIPDPKDGKPVFKTMREVQAFYNWLKMTPTIGGLYFTSFPTIQIVPGPPALIEQKEPKKKNCHRSMGTLLSGCGDLEDGGVWIDIAQKVTVVAAVVTVGVVAGGFLVAAYGPWNAVPAGTIFLATASQNGIGAEPIFSFFVAPEQEFWALPPLPAGTYLMKLETMDGQVFQMPFTITDDPDQSLSMQQDDDGNWEIVSEHNSSLEQRVNVLPNTGAGNASALPMAILWLTTIGLGLVALGLRLVPTPSRKRFRA